jgi:hypothetical protein
MNAREQIGRGSAQALPLSLIGQAIPMLSRHDLERLTERLIDHLDALDGDPDIEDSHDREAIDEREPDSHDACGDWLDDQRFAFAAGCSPVNVDQSS